MLQLRGRGTGAMMKHQFGDDKKTATDPNGFIDEYLQKKLKLGLYKAQQTSLVKALTKPEEWLTNRDLAMKTISAELAPAYWDAIEKYKALYPMNEAVELANQDIKALFDVKMRHVKQANVIQKAESIARVEGMKEGALSAPIVYFERDVRSPEGNFLPKVQTKNITKEFNEVSVNRGTKNQTINVLTDKLKSVNEEYKSVMGTLAKPQRILPEIHQGVPEELIFETFDKERTKQLLKEKESLTTRLTTIRSTNPRSYNNLTNFS
jgi:hypothetical protein